MAFMPEFAPFVLLLLLGTCLLLGMAGILVAYGLARRRHGLARKVLAAALVIGGLYGGTLLAASFGSHEKVLAPREAKYFCEVDCHEAYSVVNVRKEKTLGNPPNQKHAAGTYYVVTVKVWFDERTISNRRAKDMQLTPNPRSVAVVDEFGKEYGLSAEGQEALEQVQGKSVPFTRLIRPGESYTTDLVFDLPPDIDQPRLFITTADWPTRLLIGHENSPFHKKIVFQLKPASHPAAQGTGRLSSS